MSVGIIDANRHVLMSVLYTFLNSFSCFIAPLNFTYTTAGKPNLMLPIRFLSRPQALVPAEPE